MAAVAVAAMVADRRGAAAAIVLRVVAKAGAEATRNPRSPA